LVLRGASFAGRKTLYGAIQKRQSGNGKFEQYWVDLAVQWLGIHIWENALILLRAAQTLGHWQYWKNEKIKNIAKTFLDYDSSGKCKLREKTSVEEVIKFYSTSCKRALHSLWKDDVIQRTYKEKNESLLFTLTLPIYLMMC